VGVPRPLVSKGASFDFSVPNELAPAQPLQILPLPPTPFEYQLINPEIDGQSVTIVLPFVMITLLALRNEGSLEGFGSRLSLLSASLRAPSVASPFTNRSPHLHPPNSNRCHPACTERSRSERSEVSAFAFLLTSPPASPRSALFRAFVDAGLQPGAFAFVVARLQILVSSLRQLTPLESALPQNSPATPLQ